MYCSLARKTKRHDYLTTILVRNYGGNVVLRVATINVKVSKDHPGRGLYESLTRLGILDQAHYHGDVYLVPSPRCAFCFKFDPFRVPVYLRNATFPLICRFCHLFLTGLVETCYSIPCYIRII